MARFSFNTAPDQMDEDDRALQDAFHELHLTAARRASKSGLHISIASPQQLWDLTQEVNPLLDFEFEHSEGVWPGLPIASSGQGGFLAITEEGNVEAVQHMTKQDSIAGIVHDVASYAFPALHCMIAAENHPKHLVSYDERVFAGALVLNDAQFEKRDTQGSQLLYDLSKYQVVLPAVAYGMPTVVAHYAE